MDEVKGRIRPFAPASWGGISPFQLQKVLSPLVNINGGGAPYLCAMETRLMLSGPQRYPWGLTHLGALDTPNYIAAYGVPHKTEKTVCSLSAWQLGVPWGHYSVGAAPHQHQRGQLPRPSSRVTLEPHALHGFPELTVDPGPGTHSERRLDTAPFSGCLPFPVSSSPHCHWYVLHPPNYVQILASGSALGTPN